VRQQPGVGLRQVADARMHGVSQPHPAGQSTEPGEEPVKIRDGLVGVGAHGLPPQVVLAKIVGTIKVNHRSVQESSEES
jgi:hypothetical protein